MTVSVFHNIDLRLDNSFSEAVGISVCQRLSFIRSCDYFIPVITFKSFFFPFESDKQND